MKKFLSFFIFLSLAFSAWGQLPKYAVSEDPLVFGDTIKQILTATRSEAAIAVGESFAQVWTNIAPNTQDEIIAQTVAMHAKGFKQRPYLVNYFNAINSAVNTSNVDATTLKSYIETTGKVLQNHDNREYLKYLKRSQLFFEHNALYYQRSNKLLIDGGTYTFAYEGGVLPEEDVKSIDETTAEDDEDNWEEESEDEWDDDEEVNWDEEPEDNWEDDGWENEDEETSLAEVLLEDDPLPTLSGPIIKYNNTNLNISTPYDSVFLYGTSGSYMVINGTVVGSGGKFDWESAGLGADSVYCVLNNYSFDGTKPYLKADKAMLTHTKRLGSPVEGIFEFKSIRHDSTTNITYPRFTSYESNIRVKGIGKQNLIYVGGFSLRGSEINSASVYGALSKIAVLGEPGVKYIAKSKVFVLGDSIITSKNTAITTYHHTDSIFHPAVKFTFNTNSEQLMLLKSKGGYKSTPYTTSFFNMFFKADMIQWDINSDSLNISMLQGRKVVPAYFESTDHYSPKDYKDLAGVYNFHPLRLVVNYARKKGKEFNYIDLAEKYKLKPETVRSAMLFLEQKGFVDFESSSGTVIVKRKSRHYISSASEKKDYDNIIIESLIDSLPNATLNLVDNTMLVRGVKKFDISKKLEVYITPDSSEITLLGDRNFVFDGRVNAGNFEYIGRGYTFNYDSFLIQMSSIDSVRFYVQEEDSRGRKGRKRRVDNTLIGGNSNSDADTLSTDGTATAMNEGGSAGVMYINRPDNKSGKKTYPNYPRFDAGTGAKVYFDRGEMLGGVYDKSISFEVPPFAIDSLSDSDPSSIGFDGEFKTDGILPDFEESLHVMDDYSLGFDHKIPQDGYALYETDAQVYGEVKLDKSGLRSKGRIEYLTTTLTSEDLLFYPDSVVGSGQSVVVLEQEYNGIVYPDISVEDYDIKWVPRKDSMYITNNAEPFELYGQSAKLDGTTIITTGGVYGGGKLATRGSKVESEKMTFFPRWV